MRNFILIFLFFFYSSPALSTEDSIIENLSSSEESNLFITSENIDELYSMSTATYLRLLKSKDVDDDHSENSIRLFKEFSKFIGKDNAGVIISEDDDFSKTIKVIGNSSCAFSKIDKPVIIFEDFIKEKCFYFSVDNDSDINIVLSKIAITIESSKDIQGDELQVLLDDIVNTYSPEEVKSQIKAFIDYLVVEVSLLLDS